VLVFGIFLLNQFLIYNQIYYCASSFNKLIMKCLFVLAHLVAAFIR